MKTEIQIKDKIQELQKKMVKEIGDGEYSFQSEKYYKVKAIVDKLIALEWCLC
jgi:hypothetical protein